jgi:hypothetical protein
MMHSPLNVKVLIPIHFQQLYSQRVQILCFNTCTRAIVWEGISISLQTVSVTIYTLTFIICHCCVIQSSLLVILCKGSIISASAGSTTGTEFGESHVGHFYDLP